MGMAQASCSLSLVAGLGTGYFVAMRVLVLGEVVGKAGLTAVKEGLKSFVCEKNVDFTVMNGNGVTGGFGLGKKHAQMLRKSGIRVITGGEYAFNKRDMVDFLPKSSWILRPANLPNESPGRGWNVYETPKGEIAVVNLLGQSGYTRIHGSNPFLLIQDLIPKVRERTPRILLNFHASTTAEKRTMSFHVNSLVSIMAGSGTRCMTADLALSQEGTASITDLGRTGSRGGVYGLNSQWELGILRSRIPNRSREAFEDVRLQGILAQLTEDGRCDHVEMVDLPMEGNEK